MELSIHDEIYPESHMLLSQQEELVSCDLGNGFRPGTSETSYPGSFFGPQEGGLDKKGGCMSIFLESIFYMFKNS